MDDRPTLDVTATDIEEIHWSLWPAGYGEHLSYGRWWCEPHLALLSAEIMETVFGPPDRRKLIVTMPPRHGKSELVSVWTPLWLLDVDPTKRVMVTTYGAEFAEEWGAKVRDQVTDPNHRKELRLRVKANTVAASRWRTTQGGGLYTAGVGGALTGRGADLLIIDDPHKNWEEANSKLYRDRLWNWWQTVARTRLEPGGAVIAAMTRWHEEDFVGKLIANEGDDWRVVNLPAVAEPNDQLGRAVGEALWPARYDAEYFEKLAARLGPYVFGAMYQQHPSSPAGQILRRAWWKLYEVAPQPHEIEQWCGSLDCTFKETTDSDFVVLQVWGRIGANKYLLDQVRGRMDFPTTKTAMRALAAKWPWCNLWVVEDKANGSAIISELQNEIAGINPFSPRDSKEARAHATAPTVAAGNVYLPQYEPYTTDFIEECAAFPKGKNDDQVDCFTQAMLHLGVGSLILNSTTYSDQRTRGRR